MKLLRRIPALIAVLSVLASCSSSQAIKPMTDVGLPAPAVAAELAFRDFFKLPIGPKGLEPTDKLLSLNGRQIRIVGYMVKEEEPTPGLFMLAPVPVSLTEKEDGPADDLPASTLFVQMPWHDRDKIIAYRPGLWSLAGVLAVGNRQEANGRVAFARLILDANAGNLTQAAKR